MSTFLLTSTSMATAKSIPVTTVLMLTEPIAVALILSSLAKYKVGGFSPAKEFNFPVYSTRQYIFSKGRKLMLT